MNLVNRKKRRNIKISLEPKLDITFVDKKALVHKLSTSLNPKGREKSYDPYSMDGKMALGSLNQTEVIKLAHKKLKELKHKRTDRMAKVVEWQT
jgi:hypothetical protein